MHKVTQSIPRSSLSFVMGAYAKGDISNFQFWDVDVGVFKGEGNSGIHGATIITMNTISYKLTQNCSSSQV